MNSTSQVNIGGIEVPGSVELKHDVEYFGKKYKTFFRFKTDIHAYNSFLKGVPQMTGARKHNRKELVEKLTREDEGWKGGTFEGLFEPKTDLTLFDKAMKDLSANNLWKEMVTTFDTASTRKRVRSAYDGEWDYDKRFDAEPFFRREMRKGNVRIVRLNASLSFSAYVAAQTINEYGAFVAAVIKMLERCGILVELHCFNCYKGHTGSSSDVAVNKIFVKRADEYMSTQDLLKVFNSNYYRRALFAAIVMSSEYLNKDVCGSLGTPFDFGKVWEREGDEVHIYSVPGIDHQNSIVRDLTKFLTGELAK